MGGCAQESGELGEIMGAMGWRVGLAGMFHTIPRESGSTVDTKKSCLAVIIARIR